MRKQFVEDHGVIPTLESLLEICPWASFFRGADGGIWCFESYEDARLFDATR